MFRLLPWSSTLGGFNINHKMLATPPSCTSANTISLDPTTTLSLPKSQLKRKRSPSTSTDTAIVQDAPAATRLRPDQHTTQINLSSFNSHNNDNNKNNDNDKHIPVAPPSPMSQATIPPSPSTPVASRPKTIDTDKLRETLEAQLSLEVLLKHNELRLIDQEIAKSQVALEQLRRCSEIPYPGSQVAGVSTSLSNGTGMAVCPPGNGPVPSSPAPWGVTDGPYSRHYAKWLLPDPRFDGGQLDDASSSPWSAAPMPGMTASTGLPNVEGRSTRGNSGDNGILTSNARPQRGSASGSKLQALPSGYAAPKERAGPMIIRRKSDGVFVKLVCLDCRRDNFSSTQGFINHCRIAHNRNFASHDAAAVASGEPVELDEAGAVVGGSKTETSSGPPAALGYVHPLVRSAHVIEPSQTRAATAATPRQRSSSMVETPRNPTHKRNMSETVNNTFSFLASPATPHLSSLMKHQGAGVDLGQLVGEAKATVDLEAYSSADEDDGSEDDSALPSTDASAGTEVRASRQPMRTVGSAATAAQQPSTRVGRKPPSLESLTPVRPAPSYISPYGPTPSTVEHVDGMDLSANLSPNTVESNQAPSLVSDDDDDDGEAVSDCGSPGPTSSVDGDDADQEFSHINVEDDDDDDDDATTSAAATAEPKNGPPGLASPAPTTTSLSNSLRRSNHHAQTKKDRFISSSTPVPALEEGKEEKHVSFVSPEMSPDTSPSKGKKGDERK